MEDHQDGKCENCIVRRLNALKALNKEELKRISDSKISKTIKRGEVIFEEGEKLNGVFCVRNGVSKLSKMSENGKNQIVKIVTKGELLGQRSMISEETPNLSAMALNDMEVCFISKAKLIENISDNNVFTKALLIQMANDLKYADNTIVNMAQKNVNQRISETLLYLEKTFGLDSDGFIDMKLTREDISDVVGTAKEVCIRALAALKKKEFITTDNKRIQIKDRKALLKIAEGY